MAGMPPDHTPITAAPSTARHRVAVTGVGVVTSLGLGREANAEGFRSGRIALPEVTLFDTSRQRVHRAGQVELPARLPAGHRLSAASVRRLDRASSLLVQAGLEAWQQAGWDQLADLWRESIPIVIGTSAGAMQLGERYFESKQQRPAARGGLPTLAIGYLPPQQIRYLAEAIDVQGPVQIIANACASGANAIGHAARQIRRGRATRAVCGGYDALCRMVFAGFDSLQALSTTQPRPFDADRDGLALGEGAAVLMLERLDHALERGASILAEVNGYGAATDLHHLTQPHPDGDAALASMTAACRDAGLAPGDIDYINSHGTGTPLNDAAEGRAIQRWAGDGVADLMVSSTKGATGHLLGGAGAVEAAACLLAMQGQWVPPTASVRTPDPVCTFDLVRQPRAARLHHVLTNSFGFGGANATVIFSRI